MLVLSRKVCEGIHVGDSIVVRVMRISGDTVRLGIEAPARIRILRDELDQGANSTPQTSTPQPPQI